MDHFLSFCLMKTLWLICKSRYLVFSLLQVNLPVKHLLIIVTSQSPSQLQSEEESQKGEDEEKREHILKENGWDMLFFNVSSFDAACNWSQLHQLFVRLEGEREREKRGRETKGVLVLQGRVDMRLCGLCCVCWSEVTRRAPLDRYGNFKSELLHIHLKKLPAESFQAAGWVSERANPWSFEEQAGVCGKEKKKNQNRNLTCLFFSPLMDVQFREKSILSLIKSPMIINSSLYINHHVENNGSRKFSHAV